MHEVGKACDGIPSFSHFRPRLARTTTTCSEIMRWFVFGYLLLYTLGYQHTWAGPLLIGPKALLSWIIDEGINFISIAQSCLCRPCYRNIIDFWQQIRWTRFSGFERPRRRKSHSKPTWYAIAHSCSQLVFHYSRQGRLRLQADARANQFRWLFASKSGRSADYSCGEVFSGVFLRRSWNLTSPCDCRFI